MFMYRLDLTCVVYVVTLDSQNGRVPSPRKSAMHHAYDTARARDEPGPPWKSSESDEPERRLKVGRKRHTWVCRDRGERNGQRRIASKTEPRVVARRKNLTLGEGLTTQVVRLPHGVSTLCCGPRPPKQNSASARREPELQAKPSSPGLRRCVGSDSSESLIGSPSRPPGSRKGPESRPSPARAPRS